MHVDGSRLLDWAAFHDVFARGSRVSRLLWAEHGRLDRLHDLAGCTEDGLISLHGHSADPVVLHTANASSISAELVGGLSDCAAFVNGRRIEVGEPAILVLSFWQTQPSA